MLLDRPSPKQRTPRAVLVVCAWALLPGLSGSIAAMAQTSGQAPASKLTAPASPLTEEARQVLESGKRTLEEKRQREKGLQRDVEMLEAERAAINRNLIDTAKAIQRGEDKLSRIESRLGELQSQEQLVRGSLAQNHGRIAKLLAAMQRMGRNPPPVMVTRREDALQMVRSAMMLAAVFPELREQALLLSDKLNELARVMAESRKEGEQLRGETTRLADARTKIDGLLSQKRENLVERQSELRQVRQAAAELARSMTDLNEFITKLDKVVSDQAGIAEYDRELAASRAQSPAPGVPAPATQPPVAAAPAPPAPAAQIPSVAQAPSPPAATAPPEAKPQPGKPGEQRLAMINPSRMKPSMPFDRTKGAQPRPAAGRRVVGFGERTDVGATSKGVVIETRSGAQITSPSDGWVVYAGEFRSYGQLLIINGGGGYHVVMAGLTRVDAAVGQFVLAGEPVGTMGAVAAPATGQAGRGGASKPADTLPVLYIEYRKDGRSFDPDPWWTGEGSQKVQG